MSNEKKPAQIFHFDLYGKREDKYDFLNENSLSSINWTELHPQEPELFFVPKDFGVKSEYDEGFSVNELFPVNNVGIVTARDNFTIHSSKKEVEKTIEHFLSLDDETARNKFKLGKDVRDWQVNFAKKDLQNHYPNIGAFTKLSYRPFDDRWTFYTGKSKGFHCYPRNEIMQHYIKGKNVGLILEKIMMNKDKPYNDCFISKNIYDAHYIGSASYSFPLYLYPDEKNKDLFASTVGTGRDLSVHGKDRDLSVQGTGRDLSVQRIPNLNLEIVQKIADGLGLSFSPLTPEGGITRNEKTPPLGAGGLLPIDILDYIYAVLHSPTYREKYKEFLKIDFPRVPYPKELTTFQKLSNLGSQLREIHLLESLQVEEYITQYPIDGDNVVGKIIFEKTSEILGKVYINYEKAPSSGVGGLQYFDNVPQVAWDFYIGGYQPAQKWLKDRKERKLEFEDILHYQKIIVALTETDRLMNEINKIEIE